LNRCQICNQEISIKLTWKSLFKLELLCESCKAGFETINDEKSCKYCSYPNSKCCDNDVIENRSIYLGNEKMMEIIHQIKFKKDNYLFKVFRKDLLKIIRKYYKGYIVVPVPISKERMDIRNFNQSLEIAKLSSLKIADILLRVDNEKQSKKSLAERIKNPPRFEIKEQIYNQKILIIDDLYTTGTTLRQCAMLFDKSNEIKCLTLTRVRIMSK